ncbi:hypothetical protein B566_EDAN014109, partial [Ephemera danica]
MAASLMVHVAGAGSESHIVQLALGVLEGSRLLNYGAMEHDASQLLRWTSTQKIVLAVFNHADGFFYGELGLWSLDVHFVDSDRIQRRTSDGHQLDKLLALQRGLIFIAMKDFLEVIGLNMAAESCKVANFIADDLQIFYSTYHVHPLRPIDFEVKREMGEEIQRFPRNKGSDGSHGIDFEWETTLLAYLKCVAEHEEWKRTKISGLKSFFVANNVNGVGAFDDVVVRKEIVSKNNTEIVEMLLTHDASLLNMQDNVGLTSLHSASWRNKIECVKILLSHGCSVTLLSHGCSVVERDED